MEAVGKRAVIFASYRASAESWTLTFPIETENEKIQMVEQLLLNMQTKSNGDVLGLCDARATKVYTGNGSYAQGIHFFLQTNKDDLSHDGRAHFSITEEGDDDDDDVELSVTFLVNTDAEKLKLSNWILDDRMGAFGDDLLCHSFTIRKTYLIASNTKVTHKERNDARQEMRTFSREVCETVFEMKKHMTDSAFTKINNALKRTFDQI